jgi:RND superfamily putative drug exporter
MTGLTRWVLAHKRLVVALWVIATVAGMAATAGIGSRLDQTESVPGREGSQTNQAILRRYHNGGSADAIVAMTTLPRGTTVDSPGVPAQLRLAFTRIVAALPGARAASWVSTSDRSFVSADGRTTLALIEPQPRASGNGTEVDPAAIDAARAAAGASTVAGAPVYLTGTQVLSSDKGAKKQQGGPGAGLLVETAVGGLGALAVLAFVFASLMAFVPLIMAVISIVTTLLVIYGLTAVTDVSFIVQILVSLIGLGVAIDYALLIVVRWREERQKGSDSETAVVKAMERAGRAVVFSGSTAAVGLFALVVLPVPFLRSIGYGGMLIPLVSILVAITLLPVILATIGPRLDWPRIRHEDRASRFWTGWGELVVRHRGIATIAALAVLIALIIPATHLYPGDPRADSLSRGGDAKTGLTALERSGIGPGALTPFEVLVHGGGADADAVARAASAVAGVRGAVAPSGPAWRRADTSIVTVFPANDGNGPSGRDTLGRVRSAVHPLAGTPRVGGSAAGTKDFVDAVYGSFPLMVALIAIVTFVLLARAFRSLLLPLKAVVLNAMSVGAAYGMVTLVWQDGYGSKLIWGIDSTGAITSFVPLMVFAFLFGLSMDYEVFILARMREEYDRTGSTRDAVIGGLARTGRLVTSAALILFLAFAALTSVPEEEIKIFGTGLAAGILLDATVVRALLVPALVSLFGKWNWWMPDSARRLLLLPKLPDHTERLPRRRLAQD